MKQLYVPVRLNFMGGWTDQPEWKFTGCVVNVSTGWHHDAPYSPYPLLRTAEGFSSAVEGVGTGLGISSIRAACDWIYYHDIEGNGYIESALAWERENGTKGGWQDQIGAIEPGLKRIMTSDHKAFDIQPLDAADLFEHLVLFDTGIRRPAKAIGDKVRELFDTKKFQVVLRENARDAYHAHQYDTERFAKTSIEGFRRLAEFVPEMATPVPYLPGTHGTMMMGAGGGGFGIVFLTSPDNAPKVCERLEAVGMKTFRPIVLQGLRVCDE